MARTVAQAKVQRESLSLGGHRRNYYPTKLAFGVYWKKEGMKEFAPVIIQHMGRLQFALYDSVRAARSMKDSQLGLAEVNGNPDNLRFVVRRVELKDTGAA